MRETSYHLTTCITRLLVKLILLICLCTVVSAQQPAKPKPLPAPVTVVVSLTTPHAPEKDIIQTRDVDYRTSGAFNIGAVAVLAILVALYTLFW